MEIAFESDRGKVRSNNEDNGYVVYDHDKDLLFAIVADGMGGHQAGEVASEMAVTSMKTAWEKDRENLSLNDFENWLSGEIKKCNEQILKYANSHSECRGMGTTIVALLAQKSTVSIAHVGDSRCYYMNNHELQLVTSDHTLVNELVKSGQITEQEAELHPRKNVIMRAVGTEPKIEVDTKSMSWHTGDYLLLCSDGLTDKVSNSDLQQVVRKDASLELKVKELINLANNAGGEDNITLAIIKNTSSEAGEGK